MISLSGYRKYMTCPKSFDLHYNVKLRPTYTTSALIFGSAMDDALNAALEGSGDPYKGFAAAFAGHEKATNIIWDAKDYDSLLLTPEEKAVLLRDCKEAGYPGDDVDELMVALFKIQGRNGAYFASMSDNQKMCLSICCHFSLSRKAEVMIRSYIEEIMVGLGKVSRVQEMVTDGKNVRGVIDFMAEVDGELVLIDNKTAKNKYTKYNIDSAIQLKLYAHLTGVYKVAYIVINKELRHYKKKPPQVDIQSLFFDLDAKECEDVYNSVVEVWGHANSGVFPKNLTACHQIYGRPCDYLNYCKSGDETGLEVKNDKAA